MNKLRTSYQFRARLKLHRLPAYQIAQLAGVNPVTLSKLVCGAIEVKPGDERIIAAGRILGLEPEQCFERVNRPNRAALSSAQGAKNERLGTSPTSGQVRGSL